MATDITDKPIHIEEEEPEISSFKILTIGESGVGKTSVLLRYTENRFIPSFLSTIGIDYKSKCVNINNTNYLLQIWDTAGQERFKTITQQYYKGTDGILLIFDITDKNSFIKLKDWVLQIQEQVSDFSMVLIGNKSDLLGQEEYQIKDNNDFSEEYNNSENNNNEINIFRKQFLHKNESVSKEDIYDFCLFHDIIYFESSALLGENIEESFLCLLNKMIDKKKSNELEIAKEKLRHGENSNNKTAKKNLFISNNKIDKNKKKKKCC